MSTAGRRHIQVMIPRESELDALAAWEAGYNKLAEFAAAHGHQIAGPVRCVELADRYLCWAPADPVPTPAPPPTERKCCGWLLSRFAIDTCRFDLETVAKRHEEAEWRRQLESRGYTVLKTWTEFDGENEELRHYWTWAEVRKPDER